MAKKAVIYDNDGLLTDSEIVYGITLTQVIDELCGIKESVERVSLLTAGRSIETAFEVIKDTFNVNFDNKEALDLWDNLANAYFEEKLKLCEGVQELLDSVSIKHAVASTSARWKLEIKHKATGLDKYFLQNQIFSGEEVASHKPAPDVYLAAAAGINEKPEDCIAVEDSASGVKAGKAAGMYTVGCLGGSHIFNKQEHRQKLIDAGADIVINDMSELKKVIEELM